MHVGSIIITIQVMVFPFFLIYKILFTLKSLSCKSKNLTYLFVTTFIFQSLHGNHPHCVLH
jgi:hypothetical protein